MKKLVRITTIPISFDKLLPGQLKFMSNFYEVIAISSNKEYLKDLGKRENIKTYYLPLTRKISPLTDLYCLLKLIYILTLEKPEIVHSHTPKAGIIGMLASSLSGVKIRLHTVAGIAWEKTSGNKRKILKYVEKLTYLCSNKVYPNSFNLKEFIIKEKITNTKKLKVICNGSSNGVDIEYFNKDHFKLNEQLTSELEIKKNEFIITYVGRLVSDKGINELIYAFNQLNYSNIKLILVGPREDELDPLNKDALQIIERNNMIIEVGYKEDIRPYYNVSNIAILPSHREGFPNSILQAGAMKIPSIVTDINGCNEIIKDGYNGKIIPVNNIEEIKKSIIYFYNLNKFEYINMCNNSYENIIKNYSRKQFWDCLLKEYKTL